MQSFPYFGLLMGFICSNWTFFDASAALCNCSNITQCEKRCNVSDGSHSLSCFGKRITDTIIKYYCVWNPGQYHEYYLHIKQRMCRLIETINNRFSSFSPSTSANMMAFATALSGDRKRCAFSKFSSHPEQIIRCGPPSNVTFIRSYGRLNVTAEWDDGNVHGYYLSYREDNATVWKEVKSRNSRDCTVGDLASFQSYEMQIRCVMTSKCPQCPSSTIIRVPQELTESPVILNTHHELVQPGLRKVTVMWKYVHSDAADVYNVTIQKASGDPAEESSYFLRGQSVTLGLCYSAYKLSISALNKAGPSPAVHLDIDAVEDRKDLDKVFHVTLISNTSFSLSWNTTLARKYHCYSVEWWATDERLAYEPFYEKTSHHTIQTQKVAFQPYKRYYFFLHARHEKDTCNLKKVNNSDETIGRGLVYLAEGTPLTAPGNVSGFNITQNSFVITWSSVPEEDLRGFLQGYIIHYTQESNITVRPYVNTYELLNLRSGSSYCVQVAAYTTAGEGKRSESHCFNTLDSVVGGVKLVGVAAGIFVLLLVTHLCFQILKRSKNVLWPSIPNPYNSNAVQKMEGDQDLDIMELLNRSYHEETEEHVTVQEAKKDTDSASNVSQDWNRASLTCSQSPPLENIEPPASLPAVDSTPADTFSTDSFQEDSAEDSPVGTNEPPSALVPASVSTAVTNPTGAFISDYTTMELFQKITNGVPAAPSSSGAATTHLHQDYLSQSQLVLNLSKL